MLLQQRHLVAEHLTGPVMQPKEGSPPEGPLPRTMTSRVLDISFCRVHLCDTDEANIYHNKKGWHGLGDNMPHCLYIFVAISVDDLMAMI